MNSNVRTRLRWSGLIRGSTQRRRGAARVRNNLCEIVRRVEAQDAKLAEKDETIRQLGIGLHEREREAERLKSRVREVEALRQETERNVTELSQHIDVAAQGVVALETSVGVLNGSVTGQFDKIRKAQETVDKRLTQTSEAIRRTVNRRAADLRKKVAAAKEKIDDALAALVDEFNKLKAELDSGHKRRHWQQILASVLGLVVALASLLKPFIADLA